MKSSEAAMMENQVERRAYRCWKSSKNQLINVAAVVTRYFGGTKLGTGGLIRAYTHAVSQALSDIGIVEGTLQQEISVMITYPQLGKLQNYLELQHFYKRNPIY